jgi:hypothetical protein
MRGGQEASNVRRHEAEEMEEHLRDPGYLE